MSSIREIKRRIKSVKNISQVTRAMQMVAASKMRRAQEQALASRPYAVKAWEILTHLAAQKGGTEQLHPLLTHRDTVNHVCIILITSDKGLAGAYNGNIVRATTQFMAEHGHQKASLITVGRKGRDLMLRYGRKVIADFTDMPSRPKMKDIYPMAHLAIDGFLKGEYDQVYIAYTDFVNTLKQEPTIHLLLPIQAEHDQAENKAMNKHYSSEEVDSTAQYIYEPNPEKLLGVILPRFTELQIYQAILESTASEHSARMVAMQNATENAKHLVSDLTLTYNKVRQDAITKEMLDIVGGANALAQAS